MAESGLDKENTEVLINQGVHNIWSKHNGNMQETIKELRATYQKINWGNDAGLRMKVLRLDQKMKKLKKNKQHLEYKSLMCSPFTPSLESGPFNLLPTKILQEVTSLVKENKALKREMYDLDIENENLEYQVKNSERKVDMLLNLLEITTKKIHNVTTNRQENEHLREQIAELNSSYDKLSNQFDDAVEELHNVKLKLSKESTRNLNKKIKRRDSAIKKQGDELQAKDEEIHELKEERDYQQKQLESLKQEKRNLLVKVCRLRKNQSLSEEYEVRIEELKNDVKIKEAEISQLEQTNEMLSNPVIETYYDGKYSNEIRETIMTLITECGVSQKKVNNVLKTVVEKVAGKTLSRLPSTGVKSRLLLEAKRVAQCQVVESLLEEKNNTLHQDGTSKFHRHFQGFQFTTHDGTQLSSGISEVASGSAESLLDEFKQLATELGQSYRHGKDTTETSAQIISSIRSTMSDQCSVNPSFNKKLAAIKEEVLPAVYENWETLNEDERSESSKLFSFFCKMHLFINMATEVDKCLLLFEKSVIADGRNPYSFASSESGCVRLIRTASKALTSHGCEKSGVASHFSTYLKSKGLKSILTTFRGHRFNHLFHSAGATFYHANDIKDFLSTWSNPNELLNSVNFDVQEIVYVSGVRALGLIDKLITGPLWRIIESVPNVLSLNEHLLQLKIQLETWSRDASSALDGECVFAEDVAMINKDDIFEALTAPSENPLLDMYTQMAFEICCSGMLIILERQAKDQLPGGKYWALSVPEINQVASVPTTNTVSERDFAQLDILMRTKPSAATTTYEAIVMWSNNKTSTWLSSLPENEKTKILDNARQNVPQMKQLVKQKQQQLYQQKLNILRDKQEKKANKEAKQQGNKIKLTQKITESGGLWTDAETIENYKTSHTENEFKVSLTAQLQFHKTVLQSNGPKELFQLQCHGKQYTVDELETNLRTILNLNENFDTANTSQTKNLQYKSENEINTNVTDLKKSLKSKIQLNREKIIISQQKDLLPSLIEHPEKLIGKRIKHKCKEEDSETIEWVNGVVVRIKEIENIRNPKKVEFYIKYDEDDDEWFFPLLLDLEKGDLIIDEN